MRFNNQSIIHVIIEDFKEYTKVFEVNLLLTTPDTLVVFLWLVMLMICRDGDDGGKCQKEPLSPSVLR